MGRLQSLPASPWRPDLTVGRTPRGGGGDRGRPLQLAIDGDAVAPTTIDRDVDGSVATSAAPTTLADKIEAQLATTAAPLTAAALRRLCKVRNATLTAALTALVAANRIHIDATGCVISR